MKTIKTNLKSNLSCHSNQRKMIILFILCNSYFLFPCLLKAQETTCANEIINTNQLKDTTFLNYLKSISLLSSTQHKMQGNVLEIPIVVHVLHTGEPIGTGTNISDEQIFEAVRGANERWRNLSSDGVDMEVQFCLAQFDPAGNPSNGINRKDASGLANYVEKGIGYIEGTLVGEIGSDETQTKNLSNWPHDYVYNIWVVNKIAGNWGGFAMFPLWYQFSNDGTVIIANAMRYSSSTLAHEIGHGLGLFHTFQASTETTCPANANCSLQGDQVCDTPPHKKSDCTSSTCNNSPDSALSFKNIMSYCGGRGIFTQGQKTRMSNTITTSTRRFLLNSTACTGLPCDTTKANFSFLVGSNNTVTFTNTSSNSTNFNWNFGDDSISTQASLTHQYLQAGTYVVSLVSQNSCNIDSIKKTILIPITTAVKYKQSASTLLIYPNPTTGNFNLKYDVNSNEIVHLEVINSLGKLVQQQILSFGKEHFISFNNKLPIGIYQIQVKKNNEIIGSSPISIY